MAHGRARGLEPVAPGRHRWWAAYMASLMPRRISQTLAGQEVK
jgi:hypothetical protein